MFASLVFLDITQDCSLGQCLTSSGAETSTKKFCDSNSGLTDPNRSQNFVFHYFLFYFIKRGKTLLNWCFISVDYIEFLSPITQLLPSLGIISWMIFNQIQNEACHAIQEILKSFYFSVVERPDKLACFRLKCFCSDMETFLVWRQTFSHSYRKDGLMKGS